MDSASESEDVPEEVFESLPEDSLVVFLELELVEELLRLRLLWGCLFLVFGPRLFLARLEGLE